MIQTIDMENNINCKYCEHNCVCIKYQKINKFMFKYFNMQEYKKEKGEWPETGEFYCSLANCCIDFKIKTKS